ncbi:hypothetical protein LCGC14_1303620 [marine sediment metagenome]|uniref:RNA polymerase sigma-70 region 4 domain-containing protein n=1 Tax=marine sediment metagenome TaxID=412755 RepID=A0A0F9KQ27_9ZZZZ
MAKLTEKDKEKIFALYKQDVEQLYIAQRFFITRSRVNQIIHEKKRIGNK